MAIPSDILYVNKLYSANYDNFISYQEQRELTTGYIKFISDLI